MSKIIDKIITSSTAPNDTNVLWDDGKTLKIFRNGRWESTGLTSEQQDMIQKFLDAYGDLPEDLDTLKEIVDSIKNYSPNWTANEGEAGYIENRTHHINGYEDKEIFQGETSNHKEKCVLEPDIEYTISIPNITLPNGNSYSKEFILNAGDMGGEIIIDSNILDKYYISYNPVEQHIYLVNPVTLTLLYYNYIITKKSPLYKQLDEQYIPDTIARVADYEALEARVAELEAKLNDITITVD